MFCLKDIVNGSFNGGMMKVLKFEEQEDGSAIVELDVTEEEQNFLIGYAVNDILKKAIESEKLSLEE